MAFFHSGKGISTPQLVWGYGGARREGRKEGRMKGRSHDQSHEDHGRPADENMTFTFIKIHLFICRLASENKSSLCANVSCVFVFDSE